MEIQASPHVVRRVAYGVLAFGAVVSLGFFGAVADPWAWRDPFPRVLGFLLWIEAPFLLVWAIALGLSRRLESPAVGWALLAAALAVVGSGVGYHTWVAIVLRHQDAQLAFIFAPLWQLAVAIVFGLVCVVVVVGAWSRQHRSRAR